MPAPRPDRDASSAARLGDYLVPERVTVDLPVTSKKRLLEEMAALLHNGEAKLNRSTLFRVLTEREQLGSTGIGHGIALPHGRVNGLDRPIVAIARLRRELDFDAIDGRPVKLAVGLLVPAEAHEGHLQLLSTIARLFGNENFRRQALEAADAEALYRLLDGTDANGG